LVAGTFTLADVSVACQLVNLAHAGVEVDAAKYPTVAAWFGRIAARPTFKALVEQDQGFLARLAA
jgi:glutathione S-transferase